MSKQGVNKSESNPKEDDEERMRSPSVLSQSSMTSGALEWDHTADIGKYKDAPENEGTVNSGIGDISTIERMAINKSSDLINQSSNPDMERQFSSSRQKQGQSSSRKASSFFPHQALVSHKEIIKDREASKVDNERSGKTSEAKSNSSDDDSHTMKDDQLIKLPSQEGKQDAPLSPKKKEEQRWSSGGPSMLEMGQLGFFNIAALKQPEKSQTVEIKNAKVDPETSKTDSIHPDAHDSHHSQAVMSINVSQSMSINAQPNVNQSDRRYLENQYSDANKSETGDSQFADASDSPFEDKHSPFTDAHESAVEDTSNSEFVDANDSAPGEQTTSEFTDAHESIDVQYTDSDRSKNTDNESIEDKLSAEYQLHSTPTYTVLEDENSKRSQSKQSDPSDSQKPNTVSSSEVSDPISRPSGSLKSTQAVYPTTSSAFSRQSDIGTDPMDYRTSSPSRKTKLYNIQDSLTEPGDTSDENETRRKNRKGRGRGMSDASTDWEYGNENSRSDPTSRSKSREGPSTHSDNGSTTHGMLTGRSSLSPRTSNPSGVERTHSSLSTSEWQTSGLTRSELEYKIGQSKANSSSTGTSSVIWLELLANQENDLNGDPKLLRLKNRGVQTQPTNANKVNKRSGPGNDKDNTESSSSSKLIDDSNVLSRSYNPNLPKKSHLRREDNPRIRRGENSRERREEKPRTVTTSSSELSPACKLIEKIIKTSPTKPSKYMKVIDEHKYYHATKVEKDLRHLERLVKIIHGSGGAGSSPSSSSSSTSTADETDSSHIKKYLDKYSKAKGASPRGKFEDEEDLNFKRPSVPYSKQSNKRCQTSNDQSKRACDGDNDRPGASSKVLPKGTKYRVPDNYSEKRAPHKTNILPTLPNKHKKHSDISVQSKMPLHKDGTTNRKIDPHTAVLHERIDALSSKFDTLADLLILSQEIAIKKELEKENKKKMEKAEKASERVAEAEKAQRLKQPVKQPLKPPVCFFIPFPNSRCSPYAQKNIENEDRQQWDKIAERRNLNESPIFEKEGEFHENENSDYEEHHEEKENCDPMIDSQNQNCKSLQDAFQRYHTEFISRTKEREAILTRLRLEREMRAEKKREWVQKYGECPSDASTSLDKCLPPKGPRVMTHKEMKKITAKNYKKASEVQERNLARKHEQEKKTNRLMSQLFARRLRQKALRGDVNILHSTSLVRK